MYHILTNAGVANDGSVNDGFETFNCLTNVFDLSCYLKYLNDHSISITDVNENSVDKCRISTLLDPFHDAGSLGFLGLRASG